MNEDTIKNENWSDFLSQKGKDYFTKICREERQFALFLYNDLCKYFEKDLEQIESEYLLKILDGVKKIHFVAYEVTFMRDIFKKYKDKGKAEDFNTELIKYAARKIAKEFEIPFNNKIEIPKGEREYNFGGKVKLSARISNNKEHEHINTKLAYLVRWMMNAKPDIGIIYDNDNGDRDIRFIECKYESGESEYKIKGVNWRKSQTEIQTYIREFLMKFLGFSANSKSVDEATKSENPVIKVKFIHKNDTKKGNFDVFIDIEDLLKTLD